MALNALVDSFLPQLEKNVGMKGLNPDGHASHDINNDKLILHLFLSRVNLPQ